MTIAEKHHAYTPSELAGRISKANTWADLVDGIFKRRSISVLVGDSGLGKSAFGYQLAVCVASGKPFLGHAVRQGRVLVLDFENGLRQVRDTVDRIAQALGVRQDEIEENLRVWNANDAPATWNPKSPEELIKDYKPDLVIIDSLGSWCPEIEESNTTTNESYGRLRAIVGSVGCAFVLIHHIKKPSELAECAPGNLEFVSPQQWLLRARGARAIINGSDTRIAMDLPSRREPFADGSESAMVIAGFGRIDGEIPLMHLARVLDENGDAVCYRRLKGVELLSNAEHERVFLNLPATFRFKDAQMALGKGPQATSDFLTKTQRVGLLRKLPQRKYVKVPSVEYAEQGSK